MLGFQHRACTRRCPDRRVATLARDERGDTMIEVVTASLLVGLIAAAIFVGFGTVSSEAGAQRHQAQANELAQQDEQRLRGLTVTELGTTTGSTSQAGAALYGTVNYPETLDNETFTIASASQFVSASDGNSSCTSSSTDNADYIETSSTVTWDSGHDDGGRPVVEHSLVTPHVGGGLTFQVTNGASPSSPVAGVEIQVTGVDTNVPTQALTTDGNGCVVFAGLPGGTYTVSWPGYNSPSGATSTSVVVVNGLTQPQPETLALGNGAIKASFETTYGGSTHTGQNADTFIASSSLATNVFGTPNTYAASITSSQTVFPGSYSVAAGACTSDIPSSPTTAVVNTGVTTSVLVPEPAMLVDVWGNTTTTTDDPASSSVVYNGRWTHDTNDTGNYLNTQSYSSTTNNSVTFTFTGTSVTWLTSLATNHGYANVVLSSGSTTLQSVQEDTYGNTHQYAAYSSATLPYGTYTLKISVAGSKDSNSSGTSVAIDAFIIGGPVTLLSTQPNLTLTATGCAADDHSSPAAQVPTAAQGALVTPGQPYGTYTVCADNGSVENTATVANTSFTTGNTANVYLNTGATGLASGTCT
jgi:Flp pilus assembly pilin Flp